MNRSDVKAVVTQVFNVLETAVAGRIVALMALHLVESLVMTAVDAGLLDGLGEKVAEKVKGS